jgi:hypothetical protein
MGSARSIHRSPKSFGATMDRAISHARDAGQMPGITVRCVPHQLPYTDFTPGRFSHLREDAPDAR